MIIIDASKELEHALQECSGFDQATKEKIIERIRLGEREAAAEMILLDLGIAC